jgi:hypothetical protein
MVKQLIYEGRTKMTPRKWNFLTGENAPDWMRPVMVLAWIGLTALAFHRESQFMIIWGTLGAKHNLDKWLDPRA